MSAPELHRLLLHPLHHTGIEYMVTGAVAAIAYGEPRMTNDVDVVVRLGAGDGEKLYRAFSSSEYYVPPLEVIEEERQRRLRDIAGMLRVSGAYVDEVELQRLTSARGLTATWKRAKELSL